jgi:uncharacterized protein (TIGR03790 family)
MFRYFYLWIYVLAIGFPFSQAIAVEEPDPGSHAPTIILPKTGLGPRDLAVVVNEADPLSVQIGEYYREKRGIPAKNLIYVRFNPDATAMTAEEFARIKAGVDAKTPREVQAFALTWVKPYRVACMSITTAFAAGFDKAYCTNGCVGTKFSPYFNSASSKPFRDFQIRPAMSLAAQSFEEAKRLIDRGVAADGTFPEGTAYLVDTSDKARNVRAQFFDGLLGYLEGWLRGERIRADYIDHKQDVLFYFTGLAKVKNIETNTFLPGAMADHLTSIGGALTDSSQMSSLRWLEAGATGSYGAVVEPCNFPAKFPNPAIAVAHYTAGETLIEAYWKSVAMPGQGIFIGEPLANPFGGYRISFADNILTIATYLPPGRYSVLAANSAVGPYRPVVRSVQLGRGRQDLKLKNAGASFYKIVPESQIRVGL